jgi:hypothetical protein
MISDDESARVARAAVAALEVAIAVVEVAIAAAGARSAASGAGTEPRKTPRALTAMSRAALGRRCTARGYAGT